MQPRQRYTAEKALASIRRNEAVSWLWATAVLALLGYSLVTRLLHHRVWELLVHDPAPIAVVLSMELASIGGSSLLLRGASKRKSRRRDGWLAAGLRLATVLSSFWLLSRWYGDSWRDVGSVYVVIVLLSIGVELVRQARQATVDRRQAKAELIGASPG